MKIKEAIAGLKKDTIYPIHLLKGNDHFLQNFFIEKLSEDVDNFQAIFKSFLEFILTDIARVSIKSTQASQQIEELSNLLQSHILDPVSKSLRKSKTIALLNSTSNIMLQVVQESPADSRLQEWDVLSKVCSSLLQILSQKQETLEFKTSSKLEVQWLSEILMNVY